METVVLSRWKLKTRIWFYQLSLCNKQPRTQASSRYPSYRRRLGTECLCDCPRRTFPTSLTGDVTSEIAEDDWERGCVIRSIS